VYLVHINSAAARPSLGMYLITREISTRKAVIPLDMRAPFLINVLDNLLVVHSLGSKVGCLTYSPAPSTGARSLTETLCPAVLVRGAGDDAVRRRELAVGGARGAAAAAGRGLHHDPGHRGDLPAVYGRTAGMRAWPARIATHATRCTGSDVAARPTDAPDWMVLGNDMLISRQLGLLWTVHLSLPSLMTGYTDRVRRGTWARRRTLM